MTRLARIEKGVAIPPRGLGQGRRSKYPWATIQPGDSFKVRTKKLTTVRGIYLCAANKGIKVSVRREEGGFRVWRIDGMKAKKK